MSGLDVVMVIAIILFARLGVRLVSQYLRMRRKNEEQDKLWVIYAKFLKENSTSIHYE